MDGDSPFDPDLPGGHEAPDPTGPDDSAGHEASRSETGTDEHGGLRLSPIHARMLGVLVEKALATPQNYPLSVNALVTGCNQTTNRDPLTHYTEAEVADELDDLKAQGLLRFVHPTSGRGVTKYRHVLDEHLGVQSADVALLSVLLVRGPQTVAELRARTERLHDFGATSDIEERLSAMRSSRGQQLVRRLEREPGHREPRWAQLLCPEQGEERAGRLGPAAGPAAAPAPASAPPDELVSELQALRSELDQLRLEFEAFRAEFG